MNVKNVNEQPRILVITVSSWNKRVGSNTWTSLLEGVDPANVANICIREETPDNPACSRYFAISENRVLRSILRRRTQTGREIIPVAVADDTPSEDKEAHDRRYAQMKKKRRYSMLMARELVWWLGRWRTPELDAFLDDFKPDVILHSMEGYIHLNRIIRYAIRRTGARAVGYVWDDNFTYRQSKKAGYKVYRHFQRRSLKRLARQTDAFFAISDMTKREADAFFGIDCTVLTKPLSRTPVLHDYSNFQRPIRMLYTGNLLIGRDRSLLRLVKAAEHLPAGSFEIDVYTQTALSEDKKRTLEASGICRIHAPIPQAEVLAKQTEADVLIFLEDIDGPDAHTARLSFSTKITDYLSSGACIFAVGCADTAPMQYFIQNRAAAVATGEQEIELRLRELLDGAPNTLATLAERAAAVGMEKHSKAHVLGTFHQVMDETLASEDK